MKVPSKKIWTSPWPKRHISWDKSWQQVNWKIALVWNRANKSKSNRGGSNRRQKSYNSTTNHPTVNRSTCIDQLLANGQVNNKYERVEFTAEKEIWLTTVVLSDARESTDNILEEQRYIFINRKNLGLVINEWHLRMVWNDADLKKIITDLSKIPQSSSTSLSAEKIRFVVSAGNIVACQIQLA